MPKSNQNLQQMHLSLHRTCEIYTEAWAAKDWRDPAVKFQTCGSPNQSRIYNRSIGVCIEGYTGVYTEPAKSTPKHELLKTVEIPLRSCKPAEIQPEPKVQQKHRSLHQSLHRCLHWTCKIYTKASPKSASESTPDTAHVFGSKTVCTISI